MVKNGWFADYCDMTEDEKYLYKQFKMDNTCKTNLKIYKRMYDAVTLMSLDYEQQIIILPSDLNIPDEIALVFDDEVIAVMDDLYENGILSLDNCRLIRRIGNKLSKMSKMRDKNLWTLDALKYTQEWEECRQDARTLLSSLHRIE